MVRAWDDLLDEKICDIITIQGEASFNELLLKINESKVPISQRKLSKHLTRLESEHVIIRDDASQGKRRLCRINPSYILQKKLGIYAGVGSENKSRSRNESKQERAKRALRLLFAIATTGSFKLVPKKIGMSTVQEPVFETGVSANDALKGNIPLGYIKEKFGDSLSADEINRPLGLLVKEKILRPISESNGETRYDFVDSTLHQFVFDWYSFQDYLIKNMEDKWALLKVRPRSEELNWISSVFSRKEYNSILTKLDENRADYINKRLNYLKDRYRDFYSPALEKTILAAIRKDAKDRITAADSRFREQCKILDERYADIRRRYPVYHDLVREIAYPKFLQDLELKE